jgi:ribosomal protein S18 acetylase RimI-like enzyme
MSVVSRAYQDDDLRQMLNLVGEAAAVAGPIGNLHLGDVVWRRFMLDEELAQPRRNVRLWEDDGVLAGFAWFSPPASIELQIWPDREDLLVAMLDWADERQAAAIRDGGESRDLEIDAFPDQQALVALLRRRGYVHEGGASYVLNQQPLAGELASAPPPKGASVRPVDGDDPAEIAARVAIHREVWHPSRVTESAYRRLRAAPGFRPDLDLVAIAPDGAFAAYCICWYDPISRSGEFEPVGTRPTYRGQGYGRAVVSEGLRRLRALGADSAIVYSLGTAEPANRLYASCGFRELARTSRFRKPVKP